MVQEIGTEEARRLHEADAQFVEVLGSGEYDEAQAQLDAGRPVDGIVLGVMEDGEKKPGPSTFRPSVPRDELAAWLDEHDQRRTLISTLDGRLVGAVYREDL